MSRLVIYEGEEQRAEHELARAVVGLGRHPQNDIVLDDRTLSRFHARIERRDDRYVVIDLGAQNGVHLNGERIEGEALLQAGDRIDLGRYTAVFQAARANGKKVNGNIAKVAKPAARTPEPDLDLDDDLGLGDDLDLDLDVDLDAGLDDIDFKDEPSQVEHVAPQPTLVLLFNGMEVSRHPVKEEGLTIGRSKQCDVVISLLGLSRKHTKIQLGEEGVVVEDLGSQNGTWVNNERVEYPQVLRHGDILNFYDYSVLFLEDGDVDVGFPGAGFTQPGGATDDLSQRETNRAVKEAPASASSTSRRPATARAPIADQAPPDDETAMGRPRPGGRKRNNDELSLDDLGDGSFLGDEFEDGASKPRPANPLLEDDDDLLGPSSKSAGGIGTELIDKPSDLSRGAADEDLEADIAFSSAAANDFTGPTTAGELKLGGDRTNVGMEIPAGGAGGWPSDDDLEQAMMVLEASSVTFEVSMRGKPYAQIPLSQPVMRLGSDPRCEISMPRSSGLRPWHVTFAQVGSSVLVVRSNRASIVDVGGHDVDSAILNNGDTVTMGRVTIVMRTRR